MRKEEEFRLVLSAIKSHLNVWCIRKVLFFVEKEQRFISSWFFTNTRCTLDEPRHKKPVFWAAIQFVHKSGCTATEDDKRLEFSDIGSSAGCLLSNKRKIKALISYTVTHDLPYFRICKNRVSKHHENKRYDTIFFFY